MIVVAGIRKHIRVREIKEMADISLEQIVFQNKFLKELDMFCIFKFIVTNDLKIYNEESYNKLLKIINSYKIVNLKSKKSFSNNEKINEFFFYNKEKWDHLKTEKNEHFIETEKKGNVTKKKKYKNDLYCNDSLFAKNLNNKKLFKLFNFPEEEEVCNYIRNICNDFVIGEPLRLNVSFKKYDKNNEVKNEGREHVHCKTETVNEPFSANKDKDVNENKNDIVHNVSANSIFSSVSTLSPSLNEVVLDESTEVLTNGKKWTNGLKHKIDESVDGFFYNENAETSINLKQFILASREVNCCSSAIQRNSEVQFHSITNNVNGVGHKFSYGNDISSTEKKITVDKMKPTQKEAYLEEKTISNKLISLEKSKSYNAISENSTRDTYHFDSVCREDEIGSNIKNYNNSHKDHNNNNKNNSNNNSNTITTNNNNMNMDRSRIEGDSSQERNRGPTKCEEFVYKRKRTSNELSIYSYSTINNESNSTTNKFYDDTTLCLNHFRDIHNFLNRDPSGLRKIKIMLKNEIATISISPFYINFDGVRVFDNVCKAFHLDKDDYKRKRLYYVLKLCMNNESAMSSLKNIFLEDLYAQQINYEKELCEKKFGKKKDHRKKHYRKISALRKKQKSEEQLFEILNEEKRINVLYFINRFLYSQKTPLSNLFKNYSLPTIKEPHGQKEKDIDEHYDFDELTVDYFIFLMIFENKIEENFYKYLMKKIEQCKRASFKDLQKTYTKKQKIKENEFKVSSVSEDTLCDSEKKNHMTDELLLLNYIKPFPTIFWLINKNICAYISHLEKMNIIKNIEKFIKNKNSKFTLLRKFLIYDHLKYIIIRTRHINRKILLFFYNNFVNSDSFANEKKFDENTTTKSFMYFRKQEKINDMEQKFSKEWNEVLKVIEKEQENVVEKKHEENIDRDVENEEEEKADNQEKTKQSVENIELNKEQSESRGRNDRIPKDCSTSAETLYVDIQKSYNNSISVQLMPSEFCNIYNIDTGLILKILKKINTLRINGVGGISNFLNLKCIHLYFASHLSYPNTVGYILEECFKT